LSNKRLLKSVLFFTVKFEYKTFVFLKGGGKVNELIKLIQKLKTEKRIAMFDEAATKQAYILRILQYLGWNIFDIEEVCPEFSVGSKKVDYALVQNNTEKVFIEVKKVGEDLENHQEQLLSYSFQEGVKLAVLTNGITWWFYLPLNEGNWDQRKFYTIEIADQEPNEIAQKFIDFLSKENVSSGRAVENAERVIKSKQRENIINETLPKAWNKIIDEEDELLIELLAETTEKICGYKPDVETVVTFIKTNLPKISQQKEVTYSPNKPSGSTARISKINSEKDYTFKSASSIYFRREKHNVKNWKDVLLTICGIIYSSHRKDFNKVFSLAGHKRPYFSKNPNELREPREIKDSGIYVETNLSANSIVKFSFEVVSLFGYSEKDLVIETNKDS